jgi:hypothetical protein
MCGISSSAGQLSVEAECHACLLQAILGQPVFGGVPAAPQRHEHRDGVGAVDGFDAVVPAGFGAETYGVADRERDALHRLCLAQPLADLVQIEQLGAHLIKGDSHMFFTGDGQTHFGVRLGVPPGCGTPI